jgi:hypothetical protein
MAMNRVQFQPGLSMTEFMQRYGRLESGELVAAARDINNVQPVIVARVHLDLPRRCANEFAGAQPGAKCQIQHEAQPLRGRRSPSARPH